MSFARNVDLDFEDVGVRDVEAVIAGGLFGAFQGGLMLTWWDYDAFMMIGQMVGVESTMGTWFVMFVLGILLGIPFVWFVSGSVDAFANQVIMLSSKVDILRKILVPALNFSAYGVTLMGVGTIYGILLSIFFFGLFVPNWVSLMGYSAPLWLIHPGATWGWLTYGSMMGLVYGYIIAK